MGDAGSPGCLAGSVPFLSVVIPARNEATLLGAALQSVAEQRYPLHRLECVVVDNDSLDSTAEVAVRFGRNYPALAISVEHEPVPGVARAKNRGATTARGHALIFLDADSRLDPNLARDVAASYRAGARAASIKIVADSAHPLDRGYFALMEVGKILFGVRSQMMYCDRELFLDLSGFDPSLQLAEDLDFLRRVRTRLRAAGGEVPHLHASAIRTSPRRLHAYPLHLAIIPMFLRWALAFRGIGRTRKY